MKKTRYIGMMMMAGALLASSCSDFSDYNSVKEDSQTASANSTLWENISSNSNLSQFAALVEKAGFDGALNAPTYYTVWAPENGTFDYETYAAMDASTLLTQLIKNHVSYYGIMAGDSDRVHTLNNKPHEFTSTAFSGVALSQKNMPNSNGILHTLSGNAEFYPNLYEYITAQDTTDSVSNYLMKYHTATLNESKSVVGPIVDGMQTYIDSVIDVNNSMLNRLRVKYDNEDSSYTAVLPTSEAWAAKYNTISPTLKFATTTYYESLSDDAITTASVTIDPAYMQDSLTCYSMIEGLFYNNHNWNYNREIVDYGRGASNDTIYSTASDKYSNGSEILESDDITTLSNGYVRRVDSLRFLPWQTYNPGRWYDVSRSYGRTKAAGNITRVSVDEEDLDLSKVSLVDEFGRPEENFSYTLVEPKLPKSSKTEVDVYLSNVRSTTYNFYCVVVPANVDKTDTTEVKPNKLGFSLSYATSSGALAKKEYSFGKAFVNDTSKVDTMYLGQFTFPVSYVGLAAQPNLKITCTAGTTAKERALYTRYLRIKEIILRPVDLDAYLKEN